MADEISILVNKFNNLKNAGRKAYLWLECQGGQFFLTLQVHIGQEEPRGPNLHQKEDHRRHCQEVPRHHHYCQDDRRTKTATPSRIRRRARRAQARAKIAADAAFKSKPAQDVPTSHSPEPVIAE